MWRDSFYLGRMVNDRFHQLSEEQRRLLGRVSDGLTSKQIAQQDGGSHHTINAQIMVAVRILGARDRAEAARWLIAQDHPGSYERSYEPPSIAAPPPDTPVIAAKQQDRSGLPLPFATRGRPTNDLTFQQRTLWVLVLATAIALLVGGLLSGIIAQLSALGTQI